MKDKDLIVLDRNSNNQPTTWKQTLGDSGKEIFQEETLAELGSGRGSDHPQPTGGGGGKEKNDDQIWRKDKTQTVGEI